MLKLANHVARIIIVYFLVEARCDLRTMQVINNLSLMHSTPDSTWVYSQELFNRA